MSKKLLFIVNPLSGKGNAKTHLLSLTDLFTKEGWDVTVRPTQSKSDAFGYVSRNGKKFGLLVVMGGDGTLNECMRGLMTIDECKRPRLGYIPAGTTNDFASNMKISKNVKSAARDIVSGNDFKCDIGCFNEKNFIYVAAFGAFTDVAYETPQQNKNAFGHAAYILEGAKKLSSIKPVHLQVFYDDGIIEDDFIYGMVSNTNYIGGFNAEKAFQAQFNDGLFEVILVKNPKNVLEMQEILTKLMRQDLSSDIFVVLKTDKIKFVSENPVQWTLDGEFGGSVKEAEIFNSKQAVTLVLGKEMN